jgi:hypothetical protein
MHDESPSFVTFVNNTPEADPGFQVRGAHLIFFGGISCEKSRFYAKKKFIFFPIAEGGAKIVGVFHC